MNPNTESSAVSIKIFYLERGRLAVVLKKPVSSLVHDTSVILGRNAEACVVKACDAKTLYH